MNNEFPPSLGSAALYPFQSAQTQDQPLPTSTNLKAAATAQQVLVPITPQASQPSTLFSELSLEEQIARLTLAKREKDIKIVRDAIYAGPATVVALLNEDKVDPSVDDNYLLQWACQNKLDDIILILLADKRTNPQSQGIWYNARKWAFDKGPKAVHLLLSNPNVDPSQDPSLVDWAFMQGHATIAALLMANPKVNLTAEIGDFLLGQCCHLGRTTVMPLLLSRAIPNPSHFFLAASNGHHEIVRMMLIDGRVNPGAEENQAIIYAGNEAVANLLLADPRVDPTAKCSRALLMASIHGKVDVVRALLRDGRADPTVDMGACLVWAHSHGHEAVVAELMNDQRMNPDRHMTYDSWYRDPRRLSKPCVMSEYIQINVASSGTANTKPSTK